MAKPGIVNERLALDDTHCELLRRVRADQTDRGQFVPTKRRCTDHSELAIQELFELYFVENPQTAIAVRMNLKSRFASTPTHLASNVEATASERVVFNRRT